MAFDLVTTSALEGAGSLVFSQFYEAVNENNWLHYVYYNHNTTEFSFDGVHTSYQRHIVTSDSSTTKQALWLADNAAGYAWLTNGTVYFSTAGATPEFAHDMMDYLIELIPEEEVPDDNTVHVEFWAHTSNGPVSRRRRIEVPTWDEIAFNYNSETAEVLDIFLSPDFRPSRGGQLILWHGPPGTGKTTALRSLARQWKEWAELHFITDPERFFGSDADYMMNVMIDTPSDEKWRVLVLEDCGELLAKDARAMLANPQALSRFLNAVDGILGQGLKFLVLVTTNEELGKLHEAVTRPGRCLSQLEFERLRPEKVREWAEMNSIEPPTKVATLAELFAIKEDFLNKESNAVSKKVGFGV